VSSRNPAASWASPAQRRRVGFGEGEQIVLGKVGAMCKVRRCDAGENGDGGDAVAEAVGGCERDWPTPGVSGQGEGARSERVRDCLGVIGEVCE
jgi:hypothetical protein